jgi:hypothetical protein
MHCFQGNQPHPISDDIYDMFSSVSTCELVEQLLPEHCQQCALHDAPRIALSVLAV